MIGMEGLEQELREEAITVLGGTVRGITPASISWTDESHAGSR